METRIFFPSALIFEGAHHAASNVVGKNRRFPPKMSWQQRRACKFSTTGTSSTPHQAEEGGCVSEGKIAPRAFNPNRKETIMNKIFRINMSNLTTKCESVPEEWAGLGGRGLTSTIVAAEVPPRCHPLAPTTNWSSPRPLNRHTCRTIRTFVGWRQKPSNRNHQGKQRWRHCRSTTGPHGHQSHHYRRRTVRRQMVPPAYHHGRHHL